MRLRSLIVFASTLLSPRLLVQTLLPQRRKPVFRTCETRGLNSSSDGHRRTWRSVRHSANPPAQARARKIVFGPQPSQAAMMGTWSPAFSQPRSRLRQPLADLAAGLRVATVRPERQRRALCPVSALRNFAPRLLPGHGASNLACAQYSHPGPTPGANAQLRGHNLLDRAAVRATLQRRDQRAPIRSGHVGKSWSDMTISLEREHDDVALMGIPRQS
jgi:hypothetical protein